MFVRLDCNLFKTKTYLGRLRKGAFRPPFPRGTTRSLHNSLLPLIRTCKNLVLVENLETHSAVVATRTGNGELTMKEDLVPFFVADTATQSHPTLFTHLRPRVVEALIAHASSYESNASPWKIDTSEHISTHHGLPEHHHVTLVSPSSAWTSHFHRLVSAWKQENLFSDILSHWAHEPCPAFWPGSVSPGKVAFAIERAALPLFSLPNYGCLLIAYTTTEAGALKFWVPRRSWKKKTFPGLLDVTAGGGIPLNQSATSAIIRECAEEASLDAPTIRKYLSWNGAIEFPNRSPEGWLLPGNYHVFTLHLSNDFSIEPKSNHSDGEVDSFSLMDEDEVLRELLAGSFKPSSALAYVRLLMQQGRINEDTDPDFNEINKMLRSDHSPVPLSDGE